MQTAELIQFGITTLKEAGVGDSTSDVYLLLGHCLNRSRTQLLLAAAETVPPEAEREFRRLLARRRSREPLAYILGEQEFWSLPFVVDPAVLIPRPETELLIEHGLAAARATEPDQGMMLDLCCGSGVIAIILALELKRPVVAVDYSWPALEVAARNCERHGVSRLVRLVQADLLTSLLPNRRFSLVLSNPPYVASAAIRNEVEPEVRDHEPWLALDGGERGLDLIYRIHQLLPAILAPGGRVLMEIGYDQGEAVRQLFQGDGSSVFDNVQIIRDYAGHDRILAARMGR